MKAKLIYQIQKLFLVSALLFASVAAFGQHLFSGKVLAADKKTPLEFATIVTSDNNFWAISDYNGNFSISLPEGERTLIFSCLGYEKIKVTINMKDQAVSDQVFYLNANSLALSEVVVTAQKNDELATSTPLTVAH